MIFMVEYIDTGLAIFLVVVAYAVGFISASDYYTIGDEEKD